MIASCRKASPWPFFIKMILNRHHQNSFMLMLDIKKIPNKEFGRFEVFRIINASFRGPRAIINSSAISHKSVLEYGRKHRLVLGNLDKVVREKSSI